LIEATEAEAIDIGKLITLAKNVDIYRATLTFVFRQCVHAIQQ
jgi:hypothetical protein